jgi:hypothetical protein
MTDNPVVRIVEPQNIYAAPAICGSDKIDLAPDAAKVVTKMCSFS